VEHVGILTTRAGTDTGPSFEEIAMIYLTREILEIIGVEPEWGFDGFYFEVQFNGGKEEIAMARHFSGVYTIPEVEAVLADLKAAQGRVDLFGHQKFLQLDAAQRAARPTA
jgi:hypothetical protein